MNGWQPIETAPKDGTEILVYSEIYVRSNPKASRVFVSAWDKAICGDGWGSIHSCCGYYHDIEPTHWKTIDFPKGAA